MITFVVPAFNEEGNIAATVSTIRDAAAEARLDAIEIVIVNDGSTDGTEAAIVVVLREASARDPSARGAYGAEQLYPQRRLEGLDEIEEGKPPGAVGQESDRDRGRPATRGEAKRKGERRAEAHDKACGIGRYARRTEARRRNIACECQREPEGRRDQSCHLRQPASDGWPPRRRR